MNVAIVGGARFDRAKLERFMLALARKHPAAIIFTGDGRGSEKETLVLAKAVSLIVIRPRTHPEWYGDDALMCQINDILIQAGSDAIIILVGTGARPSRAREIVERVDKNSETPRQIHEVAKVPPKEREPAPRKAKKPVHE